MTVLSPEEISPYQPDPEDILKLNPDKPTSEIKLKSFEWQIILEIDGNKKVKEIVKLLNTDPGEVLNNIANLHQKGLILAEAQTEIENINYVNSDFFKMVEHTLVSFIGPVAPYVISDVVIELEVDKDRFDKANVPMLIESISQEIPDDTKRVRCQKEMLEYIKKI